MCSKFVSLIFRFISICIGEIYVITQELGSWLDELDYLLTIWGSRRLRLVGSKKIWVPDFQESG